MGWNHQLVNGSRKPGCEIPSKQWDKPWISYQPQLVFSPEFWTINHQPRFHHPFFVGKLHPFSCSHSRWKASLNTNQLSESMYLLLKTRCFSSGSHVSFPRGKTSFVVLFSHVSIVQWKMNYWMKGGNQYWRHPIFHWIMGGRNRFPGSPYLICQSKLNFG